MKTVQESIKGVLDSRELSKYRLAQILKVAPIQIDNWLTGKTKTMREDVAHTFLEAFGEPINEWFINKRKPRPEPVPYYKSKEYKQKMMSINENNELVDEDEVE